MFKNTFRNGLKEITTFSIELKEHIEHISKEGFEHENPFDDDYFYIAKSNTGTLFVIDINNGKLISKKFIHKKKSNRQASLCLFPG